MLKDAIRFIGGGVIGVLAAAVLWWLVLIGGGHCAESTAVAVAISSTMALVIGSFVVGGFLVPMLADWLEDGGDE